MIEMMNRQEFIERLENLLQNIPEQERIEAIQYYNDYFDDAGEENEQAVLDALGTPAQVAENIKRDLNQNRYAYGEEQEKVSGGKEIIKYQPGAQEYEQAQPAKEKRGMSAGMVALIVFLCILASPFLLMLLFLVIGILVAILGVWIAVVVGVGSTAASLLISGIALIITGIIALFTYGPIIGIFLLGIALVSLAVGLLSLILVVWVVGKLTPAVFKGIRWIFRKLTGKNKAV